MDIAQQRFCCQLAFERGLIAQADLAACLAELDRLDPACDPEPILLTRKLVTPEQWAALARELDSARTRGTESKEAPTRVGPQSPDLPPAAPAEGLLTPGQSWGKFLIEKPLGVGGQAEVYQAFDRLGPAGHVALKIPRHPIPSSQVERWVQTEVQPLIALDHPNIIRVADAGCIEGIPYVATRLVDGLPLGTHVKTHRPSLRQALDWMVQLAGALDAAHRRGIVHRDLKPQNIVVARDGRPLVIDFGIATLVSPYRPEPEREFGGTYLYMAPEQARGEPTADHRMDIFGLGGIMKFLLTGEGPYSGDPYPIGAAIEGRVKPIGRAGILPATGEDAGGTPAPRGGATFRALARIANKALAPDPADRYPTTRDLFLALRRLRARRTVLGGLAAAAGAAILLTAILALFFSGSPPARQRLDRPGHPGSLPSVPSVPSVPPGPAPPPPPQALLEIHFQRKSQVGSYQTLSASTLPLRTGDRIQIHAKLPEPLFAYLIAASSGGGARLVYRPPADKLSAVTEIQVPPGRDEWLELTPPPGTETILLLARRQPHSSPESLAADLLKLGPPPTLDGLALLILDESGQRLLPAKAERPLGEQPARAAKGFLDGLCRRIPEEWTLIRGVSFPHRAEAPGGKVNESGQ